MRENGGILSVSFKKVFRRLIIVYIKSYKATCNPSIVRNNCPLSLHPNSNKKGRTATSTARGFLRLFRMLRLGKVSRVSAFLQDRVADRVACIDRFMDGFHRAPCLVRLGIPAQSGARCALMRAPSVVLVVRVWGGFSTPDLLLGPGSWGR